MNGTKTVTALGRWSCQGKQLPRVDDIKSIHVYDFDNTLFASPLPNRQVWHSTTYGSLQAQDFLHNGGWWHNPRILAAVGQGVEAEEPRAWEGCWNETVVELVRLSMQDSACLRVLLTGRQENGFSELIGRMIAAKGLDFDIVALKPTTGPSGESFDSTMLFKQALLKDIIFTYVAAEEIRVYEDRVKHVKAFRDFFAELNSEIMSQGATGTVPGLRPPITAEVIHVAEQEAFMDPVVEVSEVQKMINDHNASILAGTAPSRCEPYKIKRSVFYTGYIIAQATIDKLKTLVKLPANCAEHELRYLANSILITPRPAAPSILAKVGGLGARMRWRVTGIATAFENRIWVARVQPTEPGAKIYTENQTPCVVLATRRQAKPFEASRIRNWQPVPESQSIEFDTTVGEKVLLRIEKEVADEDDYEASFPNARNARKHPREEDFPPLGTQRAVNKHQQPQPQQSAVSYNNWQPSQSGGGSGGGIGFAAHRGSSHARGGRGGGPPTGGNYRGGSGGRGAHRGGRGRGRAGYRSLDDNVGQGYGSGSMQY